LKGYKSGHNVDHHRNNGGPDPRRGDQFLRLYRRLAIFAARAFKPRWIPTLTPRDWHPRASRGVGDRGTLDLDVSNREPLSRSTRGGSCGAISGESSQAQWGRSSSPAECSRDPHFRRQAEPRTFALRCDVCRESLSDHICLRAAVRFICVDPEGSCATRSARASARGCCVGKVGKSIQKVL
jgi:hypothetical protein